MSEHISIEPVTTTVTSPPIFIAPLGSERVAKLKGYRRKYRKVHPLIKILMENTDRYSRKNPPSKLTTALGFHFSDVSRWMRGVSNPSPESQEKLIKEFQRRGWMTKNDYNFPKQTKQKVKSSDIRSLIQDKKSEITQLEQQIKVLESTLSLFPK